MKAIPHNRLTHGDAEVAAVSAVIRSGMWAMGPEVARLETEIAVRIGRRHAVAVGSGLAALRLAFLAIGIKSGDEVIVPAYSCVALPNAVLACGAKPVAVDVLSDSYTIDPAAIDSVVTPRTRALIAIHAFGMPADIAALRRPKLSIVEDCAHGIGVAGMGHLADVAISSFYATKLIGAGEGGVVLTNVDTVAAAVRHWRDYGDQAAEATRLNDKMTDIEAALARCQLARLDVMIARRAELARRYLDALSPLAASGVIVLPLNSRDRLWYRFAIESHAMDAERIIQSLRQRSVVADRPVYDWRNEAAAQPVADRLYRRLVSLPLYPTLSTQEQDVVIAAVFDACKAPAR